MKAKQIAFDVASPQELELLSYAGSDTQDGLFDVINQEIKKMPSDFWQRHGKGSITKLPFVFSMVFLLAWLLRLIVWLTIGV